MAVVESAPAVSAAAELQPGAPPPPLQTPPEGAPEAGPPSASTYNAYSYGPPPPGPPWHHMGGGPWGGHHRPPWHHEGRHHKHHHGRPPPFSYPSYPPYWDTPPPPPGWHSHHVPPPHPHAASGWGAPSAATPRSGESTDPMTGGEQSSVAPTKKGGRKQARQATRSRGEEAQEPAPSAALRDPALIAEIVTRVTQTLMRGGTELTLSEAGAVASSQNILRSLHELQGASRPPPPPAEDAAKRAAQQQNRSLRMGKIGKPPALHARSQPPCAESEGTSSSHTAMPPPPLRTILPAPAFNVPPRSASLSQLPPSQSLGSQSLASRSLSQSSASVFKPLPHSHYSLSQPPRPSHQPGRFTNFPSGSDCIARPFPVLQPSLSADKAMLQRHLAPVAPTPSASQSEPASSAGLFADLRPKKKRGPTARKKEPKEKKAPGRPRKPLLAMKCSRGEGLQGRKSGAIRKKLGVFGQKLQVLIAEQLYATTPDNLSRAELEEAFVLMLTHKVCGVRAQAVLQRLEHSVLAVERIDIPVEEAPPSKKQRKGLKASSSSQEEAPSASTDIKPLDESSGPAADIQVAQAVEEARLALQGSTCKSASA